MTTNEDYRVGDFIQVFSGKRFYPIDPRPEEIDIRDIAHALSLQCRWSGHCLFPVSVAQHSLMVTGILSRTDPHAQLWGLLHDAAEAYLVYLPRPLKRWAPLGSVYGTVEARLMAVICSKFGLPPEMPESVKAADDLALWIERRDAMAPSAFPWRECDLPVGGTFEDSGLRVVEQNPLLVESVFLAVFESLTEYKS